MLKIEKFVTASPEQWEIIIEGMRNPKNSWDRMDSEFGLYCDDIDCDKCPAHGSGQGCCDKLSNRYGNITLGPNDHKLMDTLNEGGPVHAKYRRMIPVWVTITAPLYWWKEFDTYKVGTVCNSCSTMHKIHAKEFTIEDYSCEDLVGRSLNTLEEIVEELNYWRSEFNILSKKLRESRDSMTPADIEVVSQGRVIAWKQMIQLLPTSYNQKRTILLNYEVLVNIYQWRRNHKLDEWHTFCHWIEELPYSELITGKVESDE